MTDVQQSRQIRNLFSPNRSSRMEIIQDIDDLARREGPQVYREIFRFLLGKDIQRNRAGRYWREALARCHHVFQPEHPQTFIRACLLDYLHNVVGEKISSVHDGLTGLHNHLFCLSHLEKLLALRRHEQSKAPITLALMRPDHFDLYESRAGNILADRALRQVSEIVKSHIMPMDTAALLANGEFALILPCHGVMEARNLCREITSEIRGGEFSNTEVLPSGELTVSWGLASYPRDGDTHQRLLREATRELGEAGATGNCIHPLQSDRRQDFRKAICKVVEIGLGDPLRLSPAIVTNLSIKGLALNCPTPLSTGTAVRLHLRNPYWPDSRIIDATVRRSARNSLTADFSLGLEFHTPQKELMLQLAA